MDKEVLKLFPQRAFKLLSIKDSLRVTGSITKSLLNQKDYLALIEQRKSSWKWNEIEINQDHSKNHKLQDTKENGENILLVYFSQFFDDNLALHVDYRDCFSSNNNILLWKPSKMHYKFSTSFIEGVRKLYSGFYLDNPSQFESGLTYIGIIQPNMNQQQKDEVIELFTKYFGEGKNEAIRFSLSDLQKSFNEIFSFFIKKNIPLNPEFAVLGLALVTLYNELQKISHPLDVKGAFLKAHESLV